MTAYFVFVHFRNMKETKTAEKRTEFTVPSTAVQFETELKKVKKDPDEFYRYFSVLY